MSNALRNYFNNIPFFSFLPAWNLIKYSIFSKSIISPMNNSMDWFAFFILRWAILLLLKKKKYPPFTVIEESCQLIQYSINILDSWDIKSPTAYHFRSNKTKLDFSLSSFFFCWRAALLLCQGIKVYIAMSMDVKKRQ